MVGLIAVLAGARITWNSFFFTAMKGIYCSMVLCLFLALVALGLQIAASVTQGWKIIEGEHLIQRAPWVTPSMFKMGENETKHVSVHYYMIYDL